MWHSRIAALLRLGGLRTARIAALLRLAMFLLRSCEAIAIAEIGRKGGSNMRREAAMELDAAGEASHIFRNRKQILLNLKLK